MMNDDDVVTSMLNRSGRRQLERLREQQMRDTGNPIADDPKLHGILAVAIEQQLLERYDELIAAASDPDVPRSLFHDVAGFMSGYIISGAAMRAVSVK